MVMTDALGFPASCGMCEATSRPLFSVPDDSRPSDRAPRAVCRFCFIRIVGIVPRQRLRVDPGTSGRAAVASKGTGERPTA